MISTDVTEDFCDIFDSKEECVGAMARTVAVSGHLPEGVDPDNPRVKQIVLWCKENSAN